jgi:hypothetical protein
MKDHQPFRRSWFTVVVIAAMIVVACSDEGGGAPSSTPTRTPAPAATPVPDVANRATLRGSLTLDGAPLETDFLGARVVRDGLVGACQAEIPAVSGGAYELPVSADAEVRGCGAPGATIILWAYVGESLLFSNETVAWPGDGAEATFDATFSSAQPAGASLPVTELKGLLYDANSNMLPGGSVVEAYVGETLCGVTSMRHGFVTEGYYTLIVAGPESVPACAKDAPILFRIDGAPAEGTAINDLGGNANGEEVNLTLR